MKGADAEANYADPDALALPSGGYRLYVGEAEEHQIVSFSSRDGVVWIREEGTRVTGAAFPDAVLLPDGSVRLYYQQFSQKHRAMVIKSAISTDGGLTFAEEPGVRVAPDWHGERDPDGVAGPSTVLLPDGRYRMYYIGRNHDDAYFNGMKNVVLSAISVDGLQWDPEEGVRVAPEDWVDVTPPRPDLGQRKRSWIASPEAVLTPDGETKLYFWGICHGVCLSTSADGLSFERVEQVFSNDQLPVAGNAGDPAILRLEDGTRLLFYNSLQNGYRSIYIARWKAGGTQPSPPDRSSPTASPRELPPLTPTLLEYGDGQEEGKAVLCRPEGDGPFPTVLYSHGRIVDEVGYEEATKLGYNLDGICQNLAQEGFLAFVPLRGSGPEDIPRHKEEVLRALDYVVTRPEADASRVALMGFSRGALLTLMVGVERTDLDALVILAPAPGQGYFAGAVEHIASLNAPVFLAVEASDSSEILGDFEMLEQALHDFGMEARAIRYTRGGGHRLFWDVGYWWEDTKAFLHEKLGGGEAPGTTAGPSVGRLDIDAPLPEAPPDEEISLAVGPVNVITYNPVTITGLEYSTNLYFRVHNNGAEAATVRLTSLGEVLARKPEWMLHLFSFFRTVPTADGGRQADAIRLAPGAEATLEFLVTNEGEGEVDFPFSFRVDETGDEATILLTVRSMDAGCRPACAIERLPKTAAVTGRLFTGDGQPVPDVEVSLFYFFARAELTARTDSLGYYTFQVPSIEDIRAALGSRRLPYSSIDYFLLVDAEGFQLAYRDGIAPARGETVMLNLTLEPMAGSVSYRQIGGISTDGAYGYWRVIPDGGFNRVAAVQAKHPPAPKVPGHFLAVNRQGQELWQIATRSECWGFDVADDGRVAAACHDGTVYLVGSDGSLLWELDVGAMSREIKFSPDGSFLFAGPYKGQDVALLDAATSEPIWTYRGARDWLRSSKWSADGKRVVAGFGKGTVAMFTSEGVVLWEAFIGQFPTLLEIDAAYNVYAGGKNREVFSFDSNGNLRWSRRIPDHVVTSGTMSADGKSIVIGTVGGWLYAFDDGGEIVWRRKWDLALEALDMSPGAEWIVAGTVGVFRPDGTLAWSHRAGFGAAVAISDDGAYIAAAYGDSTIRIFEREG